MIESEIDDRIRKVRPIHFPFKIIKTCQDLGCRGDEIEVRIILLKKVHQQIGIDNNSALYLRIFKDRTEPLAVPVRQVFLCQKRIREGQPGRDSILIHKRNNILSPILTETGPSAAPKSVGGSTVNGFDPAPVVEIFRMFPIEGQKSFIKFIEFKEAGEMVVGNHFISSYGLHSDFVFRVLFSSICFEWNASSPEQSAGRLPGLSITPVG